MVNQHVKELRLVVICDDFDSAVSFYRDQLGLTQLDAVPPDNTGRVVILEAGKATLELIESATANYIDRIEVGHDVSGKYRIAFNVDDVNSMTQHLTNAGAKLLGAPKITPFKSINSRLSAPADLQLTLFEFLDKNKSLESMLGD